MPQVSPLLPEGIILQPFHPHLFHDPERDILEYLEADASVTEEQVLGSHIVVLRDNATNKVVGVRLECYSSITRINA